MFPIGDSPNPRGIAWVTYLLIAVNVLVFVAYLPAMNEPADPDDPRAREYLEMVDKEMDLSPEDLQTAARQLTEYDLVVFEYGSRPSDPSFLDMLTSMFLHGGWMHLLGNMLFLFIYGNNAEFRIGRVPYLLAYLATGYAAAYGDMFLRPDSGIPAVGASGAISGVLGMYFIWFPHNKIRILLLMPPVIRTFEWGARWVLGFYIVANNLLPVLIGGGGPGGVAYGAHIAGFAGGLVVAFGDNVRVRLGWGHTGKAEEVTTARTGEGGLLGAFRRNLASGDLAGAAALLLRAPRELVRAGVGPEEAVALADALYRTRASDEAAAVYDQALRMRPQGEVAAAAHLGLARVLLDDLHQPTAAYQHVYDAARAGMNPVQEAEARALLQRLQGEVTSIPREASRLLSS